MLSQNEETQDAMNMSQDENDRQSESEVRRKDWKQVYFWFAKESEESSGEELTPEAIYNRLKISWMNERIAPELLPNDEDVTEVLSGWYHTEKWTSFLQECEESYRRNEAEFGWW